jgi:hypothetical protein
VVVAISINLSRILSFAQLPPRAGEALILLVGAIVLTSVVLVPGQPSAWLGAEMSAIGGVTLIAPLVTQLRAWGSNKNVSLALRLLRLAVSLAASAPFIAAGLIVAGGSPGGFYWAAAGVIISLVAGVWNTWILLVEILR